MERDEEEKWCGVVWSGSRCGRGGGTRDKGLVRDQLQKVVEVLVGPGELLQQLGPLPDIPRQPTYEGTYKSLEFFMTFIHLTFN